MVCCHPSHVQICTLSTFTCTNQITDNGTLSTFMCSNQITANGMLSTFTCTHQITANDILSNFTLTNQITVNLLLSNSTFTNQMTIILLLSKSVVQNYAEKSQLKCPQYIIHLNSLYALWCAVHGIWSRPNATFRTVRW